MRIDRVEQGGTRTPKTSEVQRGKSLMAKALSVDLLLRWAYRDELPKDQTTEFLRPEGFGLGWGKLNKLRKYMANVQEPDIRNRFGLVPDLTAQQEPHIDARRVWNAVQDLAGLTLTLPEDWNPLSDMDELGPHAGAAVARAIDRLFFRDRRGMPSSLRSSVTDLVEHAAIMGAAPDWEFAVPERKVRCHKNGKARWYLRDTMLTSTGRVEIEVDGFDRKRRMPKPGAYQKFDWKPEDPAVAAESRGKFEIWHAAMGFLVDELRGFLDDYDAQPLVLPARPWEEGGPTPPRMLADLRPRQPPTRSPRPLAGPPPFRGIKHTKTEPKGQAA